MGQQQLLLIVLSVIIVGIAVVVGINMFGASAVSANQDAVINDLMNFGARAQQYWVKPTGMGGGGNSFLNLDVQHLDSRLASGEALTNSNGTYTIGTGTSANVVLTGKGKVTDSAGKLCVVTATVTGNNITIAIGTRVV